MSSRWWAEVGKAERPQAVGARSPLGRRFFRAAEGFQQEVARERLTDHNVKILREVNPPEGGWGYIQLAPRPIPDAQQNKIRTGIALPEFARAVLVDCGRGARVLVTGTPVGERILELTLGATPSFDCWIRDEWVREEVFRNPDQAIKVFRRRVVQYLSPESIARADAIAARV